MVCRPRTRAQSNADLDEIRQQIKEVKESYEKRIDELKQGYDKRIDELERRLEETRSAASRAEETAAAARAGAGPAAQSQPMAQQMLESVDQRHAPHNSVSTTQMKVK